MPSLGALLRELREKHGASLDDISQQTRVSARFLEAIEADDLAALPAAPFTRGFIRAYCEFLHEPAAEALALYTAAAPGSTVVDEPRVAPPRIGARPGGPRGPVLLSLALLVVLGVALLAVTLALQSSRKSAAPRPGGPEGQRPELAIPAPPPSDPDAAARGTGPSPAAGPAAGPDRGLQSATVPGPAGVPLPAPAAGAGPATPAATAPQGEAVASAPPRRSEGTPGASPVPHGATAAPGPTPATTRAAPSAADVAGSAYRLVARTTAPTWIRVRMADGRTTEETIPPGEVREWISNRPFVLTIGNAGGVALELNGHALPALGRAGEVIGRLTIPAETQ